MNSDLWAITSYFNPCGYRRRLKNYHLFRSRLGVPLVAVELAYGESFELSPDDADIVIQVRAGDVMWQKERLLNLAIQRVPDSAESIAWLDADIVFVENDWAARAVELLKNSPFTASGRERLLLILIRHRWSPFAGKN